MIKKRILAILLVIAMAVTLVPAVAFATTDNNATDYADLVAEIEALKATGGTVTMTADIKISDGFTTIPAGVTLKTDGNTLTVEDSGQLTVDSNGAVTVDNGGELIVASNRMLTVESGATLTVNDGATLTVKEQGILAVNGGATLAVNVGGSLVVNNGATLRPEAGTITGNGIVSVADFEVLDSVINFDVPNVLLTKDVIYFANIDITPPPATGGMDSAQTLTVDEGVTLSPSGGETITVEKDGVLTVKGTLGENTKITIAHKGLVSFLTEDPNMDNEYLQKVDNRYFKFDTNGGSFAANGTTIAYIADDAENIDTAPSSITRPGFIHAGWTYTNKNDEKITILPNDVAGHVFTTNDVENGELLTLTAQWIAIPTYTVTSDVLTVGADGTTLANEVGGTIDHHGSSTIQEGSSLTYTFAAKEGYTFSHLLIDGVKTQPTTAGEYTFSNISASHSIVAVFAKDGVPVSPAVEEVQKEITDVLTKFDNVDPTDTETLEDIKEELDAVIEDVSNMTDEQLDELKTQNPGIIEDLQDAYRDLNYLLNGTLEILDVEIGVFASGKMPLDSQGNPVPVELVLEEITDTTDLTDEAFVGMTGEPDIVLAFDISLVASGVKIQPDGSISVTLSAPDKIGESLTIAHRKQDGNWEYFEVTVGADGNFSVTVTELSPFIVLANEGLIASSVTLDKTSISLQAGQTAMITATVSPTTAVGERMWTSSDTQVAAVDEKGVVTAIANGTATITMTIGNVSATATVTVTEEEPTTSTTPETGDDSNIALWAMIALVGLAGIAVLMKKKFAK